ncbi:MAG: GNAT family N-acetyltransferase [Pseudomonadota bacterium]|nr:GNAT family N-acetyltransferase [Pseudomonadota bacterium]
MIETGRLILRPWREDDLAPYHAMGQDAEVMRFLGPPASWDEVRGAYDRMVACQAEHGCCFWAIERRADARFLGFCGVRPGRRPMEGEIEIGWRLARDAWGQGYAREAAQASLDWGWAHLDAPTIAAVTVPANVRSWGLMERLGMTRYPDEDFDHPDVPDGSPLKRHILYRIGRPA